MIVVSKLLLRRSEQAFLKIKSVSLTLLREGGGGLPKHGVQVAAALIKEEMPGLASTGSSTSSVKERNMAASGLRVLGELPFQCAQVSGPATREPRCQAKTSRADQQLRRALKLFTRDPAVIPVIQTPAEAQTAQSRR